MHVYRSLERRLDRDPCNFESAGTLTLLLVALVTRRMGVARLLVVYEDRVLNCDRLFKRGLLKWK